MNLSDFDQTKADPKLINFESEAVRLSNELRPQKARTIIHIDGSRLDYPARSGFDCETAPIRDFYNWLNNSSIKKSKGLFWFVIRIMAVRFPNEHTEIRKKLAPYNIPEFELILSVLKNEASFFGEVGFAGMTEISKPNNRNVLVKNKHGEIKIKRK